jgi:hypothetical protein
MEHVPHRKTPSSLVRVIKSGSCGGQDIACVGEETIFGRKLQDRPSCRWENNFKMDALELKCDDVESFQLSHNSA